MKKEWTMEETVKMPVIALRGLTVFPNVLIHFDVSREISIKALEEAMASGDPVFLVGQKDIGVEYPEAKDLYTVGTVSNVRQILRTPGDNVRVMVEGGARGSLKRLLRSAPFLEAEVQPIQEEKAGQNSAKTEALIRSTYEMFRQYTELAPKTAPTCSSTCWPARTRGISPTLSPRTSPCATATSRPSWRSCVRCAAWSGSTACSPGRWRSWAGYGDPEPGPGADGGQPAGLLPAGTDEGHPG